MYNEQIEKLEREYDDGDDFVRPRILFKLLVLIAKLLVQLVKPL